MAITRIVSIDGGGVRGVIPVVLLQRICKEVGIEDCIERTQLIAGTSTGGLIALGLAGELDLEILRELYERRSAKVFHDSVLDDILDLGKLFGADYDIANLRRELDDVFGELTLAALTKRVVIASFDLDNEDGLRRMWKPKIFHNFPGSDCDGAQLAAAVGTYTSAAPTYFQSADGFIDGGVFAANPSMCAIAQTQDPRIPADERADLRELRLLSLGTGQSLTYVEGDSHDWGYFQWVRPLINIMLDGMNGIADYQCRQLLDQHYHRLAPTFPADTNIGMDDVARIPWMIDFAQSLDISETVAWLRERW